MGLGVIVQGMKKAAEKRETEKVVRIEHRDAAFEKIPPERPTICHESAKYRENSTEFHETAGVLTRTPQHGL